MKPPRRQPTRQGISKVDFYFEDADQGTEDLTPDQFTIYWRLIFKMWSRGGPLKYETKEEQSRLAKLCGYGARKFRDVVNELLDCGKLDTEDSQLFNYRAINSLFLARLSREKHAEAGRKGGKNSGKMRSKKAEICERILSGASQNERSKASSIHPPSSLNPLNPPSKDPAPPSKPSASEVDDAALSPMRASASSPKAPNGKCELQQTLERRLQEQNRKVSNGTEEPGDSVQEVSRETIPAPVSEEAL